ncbi:Fe-Mn family superoxide dismutase [Blochmannia endosymbiont of Camponotus nipponensis]|uniref:Fe-Mn family superoxide dismutase n=1 Tax=Blochmannia endosymbiont of Camponotus nipponensis TaxID=2681986 RepID=UPI00135C3C4C|nr:Fe-Mn family superoxide dismutase [Blochmannia endosymbiont of Camponotus nipponensis]
MSFILPSLTYPYDALEPFFDEKTMKIHHTKHHQAYIDNANTALNDLPEFSNLSVIELIKKLNHLPDHKKNILRNNAGGHTNHSLFWKYLKKGTIPQGSLKDAIEHNFSSISSFKDHFEKTAMNRFGSGWIWLVKQHNMLSIVSTANQDNPLMGKDISGANGYPILGLDVWEHAYYLKYQNRRLDYIKSFWNVVNWDEVHIQFNQT